MKTCSWCGCGLRGRDSCPRGPACAQEESNHEELMARIEEERRVARITKGR